MKKKFTTSKKQLVFALKQLVLFLKQSVLKDNKIIIDLQNGLIENVNLWDLSLKMSKTKKLK